MSDLYKILGLERNAGSDDIRKAYKELAKVNHPDRGGNPEKFKAIQNAHEVLSDENRRRVYDMTGSDNENISQRGGMAAGGIPFQFSGFGGGFPGGFPGVSFDMSEMLGNLFGGNQKQRRGGKGPNKYHDIGLRLADFYKGHDIKLKFNQGRKCTGCSGTGAESSETCGPCSGSGVRTLTRQIGPGMLAQTRAGCDVCNGEGNITAEEKAAIVTAVIAAAVSSGQPVTAEQIQSAGVEYKDLPAETPIEVRQDENGNEVIIVAEVAAALQVLESPSELIGAIFDDPGQVILALGSIGADMSTEERKEATEMVVATVVAAGAAMNAAAVAGASATSTASTTGGGTGGTAPNSGGTGGGPAAGNDKPKRTFRRRVK